VREARVRNLLSARSDTAAGQHPHLSLKPQCNFLGYRTSHLRPAGANLPDYLTHSTEKIMKKIFGSLALACILTASMSAFAQDSMKQDSSQQDTMKKDNSMKNDSMKKDDSKKTSKKAKAAKKDNMKNDNMKKDDNMKHDDTMKNDQMKQN
jgi:pentapeptide MXKDX repeat protein